MSELMVEHETVIGDWASAFTPPPDLLPSEWADQKFKLPKKSASKGGRWRTSDVPYLREILDVEREPGAQKIAIMKGAQIAMTTALQISMGYNIECDPCSMLFMQPTQAMVEKWSKTRLDDMIDTVPEVSAAINQAKSTLTYKDIDGGSLALAGANTPNSFAGVDVRKAYGDDCDRFPPVVGDEGDPADLLVNRTDTYYDGVVWFVSTPTLKDGRIDTLYRRSDQRRWHVTCEGCGHSDWITWSDVSHFHIRYEGKDPDTACIQCPKCEHQHDEAARRRMVRAGEWLATAIAQEPGLIGFHIPTMLSTLGKVTLSSLAAKWLAARENGQESLKVFINTQLGEAWEQKGTRMDQNALSRRKESYGDGVEVPAWASALTAFVDVQNDRLEMMVMAWGPIGERALVDYVRISGELKFPEVQAALVQAIERKYAHGLGVDLPIHIIGIDSGYQTDAVYNFVRTHQARMRIFATKGIAGRTGEPIVGKPVEKRTGQKGRPVARYNINVDDAKRDVMSALNQATPGPNCFHLPELDVIDDAFFAGLCAEHLEKVYSKKNIATHEIWVQDYERNEPWDCAVGCYAMFKALNPNLRQMLAVIKTEGAKAQPTPGTDAGTSPAPTVATDRSLQRKASRRTSRSSYLNQG